jgi:hypothetical protein
MLLLGDVEDDNEVRVLLLKKQAYVSIAVKAAP